MAAIDESRLSVVIATHNRRASLLAALARLAVLPERPHVVVVDNASTDGTADAVSACQPDVHVVSAGRDLGCAGRTVAAGLVDSEYVAFCDEESGWAPGALTRAAAVLDTHPHVGLVAASVLVGTPGELHPDSVAMSRSPLPPHPDEPGVPVLGFVGVAAVVRRSAYLEVGGSHRCYGGAGEDRLLAIDLLSAGWHVTYVDQIVALHCPDPEQPVSPDAVPRLRNDLWTAWLRLPFAEACRTSLRLLRPHWRDGAGIRAVLQASAGAGWVRRERRPVGPDIVDSLRLLAS